MGRIALFIDAAYCSHLVRDLVGQARLDWNLLVKKLTGGREVLRTYYYDCLPYKPNAPSPEDVDRYSKKQRFLYALGKLPRFEVRLGRLEFRGVQADGRPIFEQKRVDILMGVDLVLLASKHQISDAAILAGDSDFLPAIEAAKPEGVVVHLFHGPFAHRDLVQACDERVEITRPFLEEVLLPPVLPT